MWRVERLVERLVKSAAFAPGSREHGRLRMDLGSHHSGAQCHHTVHTVHTVHHTVYRSALICLFCLERRRAFSYFMRFPVPGVLLPCLRRVSARSQLSKPWSGGGWSWAATLKSVSIWVSFKYQYNIVQLMRLTIASALNERQYGKYAAGRSVESAGNAWRDWNDKCEIPCFPQELGRWAGAYVSNMVLICFNAVLGLPWKCVYLVARLPSCPWPQNINILHDSIQKYA